MFSQSQNTETRRGCCSRSPWRPDSIPGWQRNFKAIVHIVPQAWRRKLKWFWILKHNFREMLRQGNVWKSWNLAVRPWGATVWSLSYMDDSRMLERPESRNTLCNVACMEWFKGGAMCTAGSKARKKNGYPSPLEPRWLCCEPWILKMELHDLLFTMLGFFFFFAFVLSVLDIPPLFRFRMGIFIYSVLLYVGSI